MGTKICLVKLAFGDVFKTCRGTLLKNMTRGDVWMKQLLFFMYFYQDEVDVKYNEFY